MTCFPSPPTVPDVALHVVGAAIIGEQVDGSSTNRRCLVAQRGADMSNPLLWEFPGGKVEDREAPEAALRREILEELGIHIAVDGWLGRSTFEINRPDDATRPSRMIALDVYVCRWLEGEVDLAEHRAWRWVTAAQVSDLPWSPADQPLLENLCVLLSGNH